MNNKLLLAVSVALTTVGCAKLPTVTPVTTARADSHGSIYYTLPRTVVDVSAQVIVTKVTDPICNWSQIQAVERAKLTKKELQPKKQGVFASFVKTTVASHAEIDETKIYGIQLGQSGQQKVIIKQQANGVLTSAASSSASPASSIFTGALKLGVTIVKAALAGGVGGSFAPDSICEAYGKELVNLDSNVDKVLGPDGLAHSKEALELRLAKFKERRLALVAKFTGVSSIKIHELNCSVDIPDNYNEQNFDLIPTGGTASQIYCQLPSDIPLTPTSSGLKLFVAKAPTIAETIGKAGASGDRSFAYRVPGRATVWVQSGGKRLTAKTSILVAQLGTVLTLPRLETGGKSEVELTLDPATGALISLTQEAEGFSIGDHLGGATSSVGGLIEKLASNDSELLNATRDKNYYEALVAIQNAQNALENAAAGDGDGGDGG